VKHRYGPEYAEDIYLKILHSKYMPRMTISTQVRLAPEVLVAELMSSPDGGCERVRFTCSAIPFATQLLGSPLLITKATVN